MAEPADEALALARRTGDALLLSSALDAASAARWGEGRYAEGAAMNRERIELLAQEPPSRLVEVERGDAINMLSKALIRSGNVREALRWDERNARETLASAPHIAAARVIEPMYLLGEWDRAIASGIAMRESWYARGPAAVRGVRVGLRRGGGDPRAARRRGRLSGLVRACDRASPARATSARACGCSPPRSRFTSATSTGRRS